jgi:hypothetical protein
VRSQAILALIGFEADDDDARTASAWYGAETVARALHDLEQLRRIWTPKK